MKNSKNIQILITVLVVVFLGIFIFKNWTGKSDQVKNENKISQIPSSWAVLSSEELGIQLHVPPKITAHASLESAGCAQSLVFGLPFRSTIYLMPEYTSCDSNATSNTLTNIFEDSFSKKIEIIKVENPSEISGILKEKILNSGLLASEECVEVSLPIEILKSEIENQTATVPVQIGSVGACAIPPELLTIRYSPTFKKVVFIESAFGWTAGGDYYLGGAQKTFDTDIYNTLEVLK